MMFSAEKWREEDAKKEKKYLAKELSQDDEDPEARIDEMIQTLVLSVRNDHRVSADPRLFPSPSFRVEGENGQLLHA